MKQNVKRIVQTALMSACFMAGFAQSTITGTVKDNNGDPLIGASVVINGSSKGAVTDLDGHFTLPNVPDNAKIRISYVGYKDRIIDAKGKSTIDVSLDEDNAMLSELVVVGYGVVKKSDLTGAVSSVGGDKLRERSSANIMSALAGQIAGVQIQQVQGAPGSSPAIKIRGTSTITAGTNPLYVIDGY